MSPTYGRVQAVWEELASSEVVAAGTTSDAFLLVGSTVDFDDTGGEVTLIFFDDVTAPVTIPYSGFDEDTDALIFPALLPLDVPVDTEVRVSPEVVERWAAVVVDEAGDAISSRIPHDLFDKLPEGDRAEDEMESVQIRRGVTDYEDDEWVVTEVYGIAPSPDGAYLATATVTADALTTSANGIDIVNGTFEDYQTVGTTTTFAGWRPSWWFGTFGDAFVTATGPEEQIAGTVSAVNVSTNDTSGIRHITDRIYPVRPGQEVTVSATLRGDRAVDRSAAADPTLVEVMVHTSIPTSDPEDLFAAPDSIWQAAVTLDQITTTDQQVRGTVVIPDGHTKMRVSVGASPSGDGSGYSLIYDQVALAGLVDSSIPQSIETLTVSDLNLPDASGLMIGGQTLAEYLTANYGAPTTGIAVQDFEPTAIRTYRGSSDVVLYTDVQATLGWYAPYGNRRAALWFDSTAIAAYLSGKTISKVEVYLYCQSRGGPGAGVAPLGYHSDATVRSTWAAITGKAMNMKRPGGWVEGVGKWVDITSDAPTDWASGTKKGIVLGYGQTSGGVGSQELVYSMTFAGLGASQSPRLRFTTT